MSPRVLPFSPMLFEKTPLFQVFSLRSYTFSGILLSTLSMSPQISSTTAILFFPGQFPTKIPFLLAYSTSIVSYPEPALITERRVLEASNYGAWTLVDLTTKTTGLKSAMALVSDSPSSLSLYKTSNFYFLRLSMLSVENKSAIKTFILLILIIFINLSIK